MFQILGFQNFAKKKENGIDFVFVKYEHYPISFFN